MELKIEKSIFQKVLEEGGIFSSKSSPIPILSCVKVTINNDSITVVSSDTENAISKRVYVDDTGLTESVCFCVEAENIISYVKLIPGDTISLSINDNVLSIGHDKGSIDLVLVDHNTFPITRKEESYQDVSMDSSLLESWIKLGTPFICHDTLRPIMSTIYFYRKDGELGCFAANQESLFWDHIEDHQEDFEFLLNESAFKAVAALCQSANRVLIRIGERNIHFVGNDVSVIALRTEGKYPDFKRVMPKTRNIVLEVDKREFKGSVDRCKLAATKENKATRIDVSGNSVNIRCADSKMGKKTRETINVVGEGNISIGFNAYTLSTLLSYISTGKCVVNILSEKSPCIITEKDGENNKVFLIMPIVL